MSRRLLPLLAFALAAFALTLAADGSAQDAGKKTKSADKSDSPPPEKTTVPTPPASGKAAPSKSVVKDLTDKLNEALKQKEQLQRQLERFAPSVCKLVGRVDGDALVVQAEFKFQTQAANVPIFLGLKNGFLTDEGSLDDGLPHLESNDDGFSVRVDKEGEHRLTLNLRVPVTGKRTSTSGNERGIELGLPGAAVTTLVLTLPANVKEFKAGVSATPLAGIPQVKDFHWSDLPALAKSPGQWDLTIGAQKSLSLGWKEAVNASASAQPPSAKANVKVKLEEGRLEFTGDIVLEDPRVQLREWTLQLPNGVKLVPSPGVVASIEARGNQQFVKLTEPTEKLTLGFQGQMPRTQPQQTLPIGPFLVQGASVESTILVQEVTGVTGGQRLVYHPFGECYQRDVPANSKGIQNLAFFKTYNGTANARGLPPSKANLELEWKTEKGQIDAETEHDVKFRRDQGDWIIDVESHFTLYSSSSGQDAVDLLGPTPTWPDLIRLAIAPTQPFPATLRWMESANPRLPNAVPGIATSSRDIVKEIEGPLPDSPRHWRIRLQRPIDNKIEFKIETRSVLSGDAMRFMIEFPRLTGVLDRKAKIIVTPPPGQELFVGPIGQEEQPVRKQFQQTLDQAPPSLELAWRPGGRERFAHALVDVQLRDHSINVRQHLTLLAEDWNDKELEGRQIPLIVPPGPLMLPEGYGKPERGRIWVPRPAGAGKMELDLEFDVPLDALPRDGKTPIRIPLLWPEGTNRKDAKVRLWTEPSIFPRLEGIGKTWIENDLEHVPGKQSFPALVATGQGTDLALAIRIEESDGGKLPALVALRTLVQTRVGPDGGQSVQLRFLVKRFGGDSIVLDLPVPRNQAQPVVKVAGRNVDRIETLDVVRNRIRIPLAPKLYPQTPFLFEISYQAPAESVEGRRYWQTPIALPKFQGDVFCGPTRFDVSLPSGQVPVVLGTADVDYRWALQGWLLGPEPSVTTAELDAWIGQGDAAERHAVDLAWWRSGLDPQRVYHFHRQTWLLLCSGVVLLSGMTLLLVRWPRWVLAILFIAIATGVVAVGISHDYLLPAIFLGCQPALVVLAIIGAIRWLLYERYRRQLVFMPTFSRVPQGSTLVRGQPPKPREASTIDAPPELLQQAAASRGSSK